MPTRASILSRPFTSRCTRKRSNSTTLAGNYREKVGGKQCDPLHPASLTPPARELWTLLAGQLEQMKLDRRPDRGALEGAVRAHARAVEADELLDREGLVIRRYGQNADGETVALDSKPHPATAVADKSWNRYLRFAAEFGLTPLSRTRLALPDTSQMDAMAELQAILHRPRPPRVAMTATPQTDERKEAQQ